MEFTDEEINKLSMTLELMQNGTKLYQSINIENISILRRCNAQLILNLYYRIWRNSHLKFASILGIQLDQFNAWRYDPTDETKITSLVSNYFECLLNEKKHFSFNTVNYFANRSKIDKHIVFYDYDNVTYVLKILLDNIDKYPNFLFVVIVSKSTYNDELISLDQHEQFILIRSKNSVKDAADHCLTIAATLALNDASEKSRFYMITLDKFVIEVIDQLIIINPLRKIILINPSELKDKHDELFADEISIIKNEMSVVDIDAFEIFCQHLLNLCKDTKTNKHLYQRIENYLKISGFKLRVGDYQKYMDKARELEFISSGRGAVVLDETKINSFILNEDNNKSLKVYNELKQNIIAPDVAFRIFCEHLIVLVRQTEQTRQYGSTVGSYLKDSGFFMQRGELYHYFGKLENLGFCDRFGTDAVILYPEKILDFVNNGGL